MDTKDRALTTAAFNVRDALQGEDGHWYHLPTLRALYRAGRLPLDSPAYMALMQIMQMETPAHARLSA